MSVIIILVDVKCIVTIQLEAITVPVMMVMKLIEVYFVKVRSLNHLLCYTCNRD